MVELESLYWARRKPRLPESGNEHMLSVVAASAMHETRTDLVQIHSNDVLELVPHNAQFSWYLLCVAIRAYSRVAIWKQNALPSIVTYNDDRPGLDWTYLRSGFLAKVAGRFVPALLRGHCALRRSSVPSIWRARTHACR